jgi:mRNA-degrading endonuclease toxin of MazEF toxin-antitoxin module
VEVLVAQAEGMPQDSMVNLDSINTIPKNALRSLICTLSPGKMQAVRTAIIEALDLH